MRGHEVIQCLGVAESNLLAAINSLIHMSASDKTWPNALRNAAEALEDVQFNENLDAERSRIVQLLRQLTRQARTAGTLLDAAAALHFGRVMSSCSVECGYLVDGGTNNFHYNSMRIEG